MQVCTIQYVITQDFYCYFLFSYVYVLSGGQHFAWNFLHLRYASYINLDFTLLCDTLMAIKTMVNLNIIKIRI